MTIAAEPDSGNAPAVANDGHPRLVRAARGISAAGGLVLTGAASGAALLARHTPGTIRAIRAGARETTSALQTLPDPTLRSLAGSALGLGAGFYVGGAPRLAVAAGLAPAAVLGAAMVLRPNPRPIAEVATE